MTFDPRSTRWGARMQGQGEPLGTPPKRRRLLGMIGKAEDGRQWTDGKRKTESIANSVLTFPRREDFRYRG